MTAAAEFGDGLASVVVVVEGRTVLVDVVVVVVVVDVVSFVAVVGGRVEVVIGVVVVEGRTVVVVSNGVDILVVDGIVVTKVDAVDVGTVAMGVDNVAMVEMAKVVIIVDDDWVVVDVPLVTDSA